MLSEHGNSMFACWSFPRGLTPTKLQLRTGQNADLPQAGRLDAGGYVTSGKRYSITKRRVEVIQAVVHDFKLIASLTLL